MTGCSFFVKLLLFKCGIILVLFQYFVPVLYIGVRSVCVRELSLPGANSYRHWSQDTRRVPIIVRVG